jgi:hypothetical protein
LSSEYKVPSVQYPSTTRKFVGHAIRDQRSHAKRHAGKVGTTPALPYPYLAPDKHVGVGCPCSETVDPTLAGRGLDARESLGTSPSLIRTEAGGWCAARMSSERRHLWRRAVGRWLVIITCQSAGSCAAYLLYCSTIALHVRRRSTSAHSHPAATTCVCSRKR